MEWVVLGISLYAGIVATANVAWTAYGTWRDRTALKIDVVFGNERASASVPYRLTSPDLERVWVGEDTQLIVRAGNVGRRPVTLTAGGLKLRDTNFTFSGEGLGRNRLPYRLEEGQSFDLWAYLGPVQDRVRENRTNSPIWAYWDSEAGKVYKSKLPKRVRRVLAG